MKKYVIFYSGISRAENNQPILFEGTLEEANKKAWELACDDYQCYEGMNGIRDVGNIVEEEGLSWDEAELEYAEERESWLDYYAEEYDPQKHDDEFE